MSVSRIVIIVCLLCGALPGSAVAFSVLVLGDSLSAAYGMPREHGWVALLERRLRADNPAAHVVNASISGTTSGATLARLDALLARHGPDVCIIELGANDGLRGQPLDQLEDNLGGLIQGCRSASARVLLIGMRLPPNYGRRYTEEFSAVYRRLAEREQVALLPFLLDGVVQRDDWMQADGLHPTAAAQPYLQQQVHAALAPLIDAD